MMKNNDNQTKNTLENELQLLKNELALKEKQIHSYEKNIETKNEQIHSYEKNIEAKNAQIKYYSKDIDGKLEEILCLHQTIDQLKHYLSQERRHRYGKKSEKLSSDDQPCLPGLGQIFDEACDDEPSKKEKQQKTGKRKAQGGRKPLPKDLPRKDVIHDISEDQKTCKCGHELHHIGEEVSEQLDVIPAQLQVTRHRRLKYGCKSCEETVLLADMPKQPLPKSMAAPGLLSHIIVSKFDDHLPLYRQSEIWQRNNIDLDRTTLGRWVTKCGKLLKPLVELMEQDMLKEPYLQADETTVQVLKEKGKKPSSKSYMWVYKTGGSDGYKISYHYADNRRKDDASAFLKDYQGYLQSDGWHTYKQISKDSDGKIISAGCWAHARRKFFEVHKNPVKKGIAFESLEFIKKLYKIEQDCKEQNRSFKEIKQIRKEKAKPILQEFKAYLDKQNTTAPLKSGIGDAIKYTLNQWESLTVYPQDGRISIDNNDIERCIRPFAVGRKNWLFCGNEDGAEASAILFSLLETVKSYGHNPFDYFTDVLKKIPNTENITNLLPHNWQPL